MLQNPDLIHRKLRKNIRIMATVQAPLSSVLIPMTLPFNAKLHVHDKYYVRYLPKGIDYVKQF